MIRRWSCLKICKPDVFYTRFETKKLSKALNFKNYNTGITRFKRKKLSNWRRFTNYATIVQVLKHWVSDYLFSKRVARSQIYEILFPYTYTSQDGLLIKKKTPLVVRQSFYFVQSSTNFTTQKYFLKKFKNLSESFNFYYKSKINLLVSSSTFDSETASNNTDPFLYLLFVKAELNLYSVDQEPLKNFNDLALFRLHQTCSLTIYKTFTLLFFLNVK